MSGDKDIDNSAESEDKSNIDELADTAKIVAEATGRSEEDVLADLLDDGIVNNSHKENQKDLVTQLKEAAELITTVQEINKDVSENTVLNGGDNKTEVQIETTLEGDIVDRAIASVHRKAENIKKIALIMLPVFLLITGGTMTNMGIFESDGSSDGESNYGCEPIWVYEDNSYAEGDIIYVVFTFYDDAECGMELEGHFISYIFRDGEDSNFDAKHHNVGYFVDGIDVSYEFPNVEEGVYWIFTEYHDIECEDGSCEHGDEWQSPHKPYFTIENQECVSNTELDNPALLVDGNDLTVNLVFSDLGGCGQDIQVKLEIWNGGQLHDTLQYGEVHEGVYWIEANGDSMMRVEDKVQLMDIPDGDDWIVKAQYRHANADNAPYESPFFESNSVVIDEVDDAIYGCTNSEATNYDSMATSDDGSCEYPPEEPCEVEIQNHYRGHVAEDEEQDAILVAFRVVPLNCEDEMVEIDIELYQNGYDANYSHWVEISGDDEYTDVSHTFDGVAIGNSWTPRITATLDDEQLEQVLFWGIDVEEQEPEVCEINLFIIQISTNSTTATVGFDLDCGEETNDLQGYNVSVQFLVYNVNETNSGPNATGPLQWVTQTYYIEGYADDARYLALDNWAVNNTTHYDFYWYAMWEDGEGESQIIERKWLNREVNP